MAIYIGEHRIGQIVEHLSHPPCVLNLLLIAVPKRSVSPECFKSGFESIRLRRNEDACRSVGRGRITWGRSSLPKRRTMQRARFLLTHDAQMKRITMTSFVQWPDRYNGKAVTESRGEDRQVYLAK